ncbi:MAG: hypothetical protein A2161_03180 [Candidatus Schekmanbacteria bacterium RBG_13_48_7]|uniref:Ribbon-helix-helix protein CopG domain-containing protein n=1 Tax=Candidatus Schekmanbacteria bacterium RBG_13_48_7 TaxID=1817878 RepID=A0A1F7RS10_9BACT|nr:MAG: hypothetical protein A2161_03180 [Candidatus Schekmanbacteria bacterium RBG_13_48_7]
MSNIKTAISLDEDLFRQINNLAGRMNIPRSRVFAIAVWEFIEREQNKQLLSQINSVYQDSPDEEELKLSAAMKAKHRKNIGEESW